MTEPVQESVTSCETSSSDLQREFSLWNPRTFVRRTAREFDTETSLYYYRARYYDPNSGRFFSEDGTRFKVGPNFYNYAYNRPLDLVDPSGNDPIAVPWPFPWGGGGTLTWGRVIGVGSKILGTAAVIAGVTVFAQSAGRSTDCEKGRRCREEWDEAYEICRKLLSQPHPPRGLTGGYTDLENCARGFVSEECGGNPVSHGKR